MLETIKIYFSRFANKYFTIKAIIPPGLFHNPGGIAKEDAPH